MTLDRKLWTGDITADGEYLETAASNQNAIPGSHGPAWTLALGTYLLADGRRQHRIVLYDICNAARLVASIERALTAAGYAGSYTSELDQARADLTEFYRTHTDPEFTVYLKKED